MLEALKQGLAAVGFAGAIQAIFFVLIVSIALLFLLCLLLLTAFWLCRLFKGGEAFIKRPLPIFTKMQVGKVAVHLAQLAGKTQEQLDRLEITVAGLITAVEEIQNARSQNESRAPDRDSSVS